MDDDQFSNQLKNRRKQHSLTQQQLADKLSVSRETVSGWETGRNQPDINTLRKLAKIYGISLDQLVSSANDSDMKAIMRASGHSRLFLYTNSALDVILAVLVIERLTQDIPRSAFGFLDILVLAVLGLRLLRTRIAIKKAFVVTSGLFIPGYTLFAVVAIASAVMNAFNMGLEIQYVLAFTGSLAILNLGLLLWHAVTHK